MEEVQEHQGIAEVRVSTTTAAPLPKYLEELFVGPDGIVDAPRMICDLDSSAVDATTAMDLSADSGLDLQGDAQFSSDKSSAAAADTVKTAEKFAVDDLFIEKSNPSQFADMHHLLSDLDMLVDKNSKSPSVASAQSDDISPGGSADGNGPSLPLSSDLSHPLGLPPAKRQKLSNGTSIPSLFSCSYFSCSSLTAPDHFLLQKGRELSPALQDISLSRLALYRRNFQRDSLVDFTLDDTSCPKMWDFGVGLPPPSHMPRDLSVSLVEADSCPVVEVSADPPVSRSPSPPLPTEVLQPFPLHLDSLEAHRSVLVPTPDLPTPYFSHPVSGDHLWFADSHGRIANDYLHRSDGVGNCLAVRGGRTIDSALAELKAHALTSLPLPGHLGKALVWKGCNDLIKDKTFVSSGLRPEDHRDLNKWVPHFKKQYHALVHFLTSDLKLSVTLLTIPITPKVLLERYDRAQLYLAKYRAANEYIMSLHYVVPQIKCIDIASLFFVDNPPRSFAQTHLFRKSKNRFFNLVHLNTQGNQLLHEFLLAKVE
jgi:hypothetical protein